MHPARPAGADTKQTRSFLVERASIDTAARTVRLAFASEAPVERMWGVEVLDCTASSMRTQRLAAGANLLCDHDPRDVVGVVESIEIGADRVARAVVRFGQSARAQEVWQDVADGIRRNVSVGYLIHKADLVDKRDGLDTYRVTDWEPFEVSLVSVPADASVGVGRSATVVQTTVITTVPDGEQPDQTDQPDPQDPPADQPDLTEQALQDTASQQRAATTPSKDPVMSADVQVVAQRDH
ncbi:MAG: hypothetical protein RL375_2535, partial [Pseudomonadota bacterium]